MKLLPGKVLQVFLLLLFAFTSFTAFSQTQISGRVTDSKDNSPLSSVSVRVKSTGKTVQTAADGTFKIDAPSPSAVLIFTSIGFASQQTAASNGAVNIALVQTNTQLQDVVVVAYGTRKKSDLTGAVTSVGAKDFQKGQVSSAEQLLQGKVAGLQVTPGGGSAGGGSKLRIRSGASLNASNDPLIVIDGVPVESNGVSGSANYLNTINPNDIESISTLKDASATALYGSRASNGVLIITTKKGTGGKTRYNFNTKLSVASVSDFIPVLTANQVRSIITAQAAATGNNTYLPKLGSATTDWQRVIFQDAPAADNNLSASGTARFGNGFKLPFRASAGYLTQTGVLTTNRFERISTALNLNPKMLKDRLSVNIAFKYSNTKTRFANEGAIGSAVAFDPTQPVLNPFGKYGGYYETLQADGKPFDLATRNPLALLKLRQNPGYVDRMIGNVQLDYQLPFFPDLHVQGNFGMDNAYGHGYTLVDSSAATNYQKHGYYSPYKQKKFNYIADESLLYTKDLKSIKSKVDVLVLHSYQDFYTNVYNYSGYSQAGVIDSTTIPNFASDKPEYRIESYLGQLHYNYNETYILQGSVRRDATSKFAKQNRVGYFPSVSLGWRLKNQFFKNTRFINELKLRGGWGETGQQDGIGYYSYLPIYSQSTTTAQYQFGNTYYNFLRPSAYYGDLKWETTATTNLGLDFSLMNNRISGSVDAYEKKTRNLLSTVPVAPGSNFNIQLLVNVGNITNRGIEASLNLVPIKTKNFSWDLNVNGAYNKSKITNLLKVNDSSFKGITVSGISGGTGNSVGKHFVGYAPYTYYMYKQVYDAAGKPIEGLYEDLNRDGVVDDNDRRLFKHPSPDFIFGFSTQFNIYKFYLGVTAHGMAGNYLYNNFNSNSGTLKAIQNPLGFIGNASANYLETGFKTPQYLSDYYLENASFLRFDNINVGYDFGKISHGKATLRMSASVQNVAIITKYSGADPENAGDQGVDNNIYPRPRTYSVGASIDF